jgi:hypothetical protein
MPPSIRERTYGSVAAFMACDLVRLRPAIITV